MPNLSSTNSEQRVFGFKMRAAMTVRFWCSGDQALRCIPPNLIKKPACTLEKSVHFSNRNQASPMAVSLKSRATHSRLSQGEIGELQKAVDGQDSFADEHHPSGARTLYI